MFQIIFGQFELVLQFLEKSHLKCGTDSPIADLQVEVFAYILPVVPQFDRIPHVLYPYIGRNIALRL